MSFADRHNKGQNQFVFKLPEGADVPFKKLSELEQERVYKIRGFFMNSSGKYGKHPVAVVSEDNINSGFFVDFPKSSVDEIEEILKNPDDIQDINDLKVGFTTHKYDNKYGKGFTGFTFVDL